MKRLDFLLGLILVAASPLALAQQTWVDNDAYLKSAINECRAAGKDRTSCRHFTGEALQRLFGIAEFCKPNRCLKAVEIEWELRHNPGNWTALGAASDQAALDKARELAGKGKAVIAVQNDRDRGQVAIIMPGAAVASGSWKLNVPIAVAARVDRPERSVYGKGISWLFDEPGAVKLYAHK